MWINTWFGIVAVVAWIVTGMIVTAGEGPPWVTAGAIALAIGVPLVGNRYAKGLMLRLLYRFDPPESA